MARAPSRGSTRAESGDSGGCAAPRARPGAWGRPPTGRGFRVVGTVRRPEDEAGLEVAGVTPVRLDVTDGDSVARARTVVEQALAGAPLVALVNNAGIPAAGPLELVDLEDFRRVLEVNV